MSNAPAPASSSLSVPKLLGLLALTVVATGAVVYLALRPREQADEVVVSTIEPKAAAELKINTQQAVDATRRTSEKPELGRRYRVRIDSESREGTEGIARIGGQVIFVKGARPGQEVMIEITRLRATTAEAVIVGEAGAETAASSVAPASAPSADSAPVRASAPVAVPADATVYTGTVVFVGKFGDGLVKVDGQSVYVPGVQKGERISFIITEKRDRFSAGQLVSKLEPVAESAHADARESRPTTERVVETKAPQIQVGQEHEVTITEKERRNPELAGVGRVDGLVVIVNGTKPGDRVKVRITERKPTLAFGEIVERLESAPAAP